MSAMYNELRNLKIPLLIHDIHRHRERSIENNDKSYFEKLRSAVVDRHMYHKTPGSSTTPIDSPSDDLLENLIGSIRPSTTWNYDDTKNNHYFDNKINKSIQREDFKRNIKQYFDNYICTIKTFDGDILCDFSKQSINSSIYIQLMQLVRLSNLDKFIEKIFHKSGEYHHVDYKENRRHQLEKDQENYQRSLDRKMTNSYLTMAKAVHFRTFSHCFVLDGIDISSRFQHDRNIIQDTCHRFYSNSTNTQQKEDNDLAHTPTGCSEYSADTKHRILVLCTDRMKQIYQLFESLFKSYTSHKVSIIYITFDEIKPFLTKYEQISPQTSLNDASTSSDIQPINIENVNNENITTPTLEEDLANKIDFSNEEHLLDYFRTSSLILIFMKHLDESYLTALIQWYTESISDLSSTFNWNTVIEHCWLITSNYQRAETLFNISKTHLFLWPTEDHDFDYISIITSSILCLPIALNINYQNYSMIINGMSIIDKHCQETTIDQNICIHMALLRISKRKTTVIITCDDDDNLKNFDKYIKAIFADYDNIYEHGISQKLNIDDTSFVTHTSELLKFDEKEKMLEEDNISHSYTLISLDQMTPLTLGVLMGIYQISVFFENIIRDHQNKINFLIF